MSKMTPKEIVHELNKFIIGQDKAKRAVAIALRNRWRRMQIPSDLRNEITPKNILMIGPTGVGKTEIARRLATLAGAPFVKVEATKFTEVGYVGRDVESIIRDLIDVAIKMLRGQAVETVQDKALSVAEERVLDSLLPPSRNKSEKKRSTNEEIQLGSEDGETRQIFRKKLREGKLDDKEINIELRDTKFGVEIMAPPGMEEMTNQLQGIFSSLNSEKVRTRTLKVKDAMKTIQEEEAQKMINEDEIKSKAVEAVEQHGIVFIDEIDKVAKSASTGGGGGEISREGVQRDLLPLIEGCTVNTKYGMVKTDHILFITSGAFHLAQPSDLIPELQGRLPIRVELNALSVDDFKRILTEPDSALTMQYKALMKTEGLEINFSDDGIKGIAEAAWQVNESTENIGARRLYTVLEYLLDEVSFSANDLATKNEVILIDSAYVEKHLGDLVKNEDLSRFIL